MSSNKTRPISFRCPENLYEQLQAHAKRNRRSVSNMLEVILEDTFGEALLGRATALDSLCSFVISRMIQSQQFTISGDVQEHIARCLKSIREDCAQGKLPTPYGQEYEKALSFYKSWLDRPTEKPE